MECTECQTSLRSEWAYCPICGYKKPETLRPSEESSLNSNRDRYHKGKKIKRNRRRHPKKIHSWCCYSCGYASPDDSGEKYCPNCDCYISEYGMKEGETPVCNKCMDNDDVIPAGVRSKQYYCRKHGYSNTRCQADEFGHTPVECWSDVDGKNFNRYAGAEYICTYCKITVEKGCRYTSDDDCHCEWEEEFVTPSWKNRNKRRGRKRGRMSEEEMKNLFADFEDCDY